MKGSTQSFMGWSVLLLALSISASFAPIPYTAMPREYTYVSAGDPNGLSLANSDPETFRVKTSIDLSLKPDILP